MYLINTLGWRWARRELSEQPQKEHLEHRIERQKWQRAKMAFEQGARGAVRGPCYLRSQDAGQSGEHRDRAPPGVQLFNVLPKVAVGG